MASQPSPNQQPSPQQMAAMQQQVALEASKRGMTPQQFQAWQRQQIEADARKAGLSVDQYINQLKQQALENHQRQQQQLAQQQAAEQSGQPQVQQGQQGQQVPITPGTPDPKALAVAKWLRGQDLKTRTCILNGQRKDMFRGMHRSPPNLLPPFFVGSTAYLTTTTFLYSETCPPSPPIPRLLRRMYEKPHPPTHHSLHTDCGDLQAPPSLLARATGVKIRPTRRPQPRSAAQGQETHQGPLARAHRATAGGGR